MALTEDDPAIKTYREPLWAETADAREAPTSRGLVSIDAGIQLYAWHGLHHTAQITGLRSREAW